MLSNPAMEVERTVPLGRGRGATRLRAGHAVWLGDWPAGCAPEEIGRRLIRNTLARPLVTSHPMHYAEACTWQGALVVAGLLRDEALVDALVDRFAPIAKAPTSAIVPARAHVDDRVFGIVPLEIALQRPGAGTLAMGKRLADAQWTATTPDGITTEARYWVDDMYMITALQLQAFRATGDVAYRDRAALAMAAYLDRLQQPNGLFVHTERSPRFWGRGNGWYAAGMAELLRALPADHPRRARILAGFTTMMAALLTHQAPSGMWKQLVDEASGANWPEASSTAMFTFALVSGVKNGWLPADVYGPAARKAWLALAGGYLDADGNVREVCVGTGDAAGSGAGDDAASQAAYYFARPRVVGDFHGQAPLLWSASALMRQEQSRKS